MVAVAVLVTPPPVAVTVSVRVVLLALDVTVTVSVEVPEPPVIEVGLSVGVMPVCPPLTDRETFELNVPEGVSVTT